MGFWEDLGRGVAAVATGGLSEVVIAGKDAADKVSDEVDHVTETLGALEGDAEKIGGNLALASDKVLCICDQVNQTIYDIDDNWIKDRETGEPGGITRLITSCDELFEIPRLTPRDLSELWPAEEKYLQELYRARGGVVAEEKNMEQQLADSLKTLKDLAKTVADIPNIQKYVDDFAANPTLQSACLFRVQIAMAMMTPLTYPRLLGLLEASQTTIEIIIQIDTTKRQIAKYDAAVSAILYRDPGPFLSIAHNTDRIIDQFHTIEQPKIDDILDSVDKTIDETGEVMEQVKALFVIRTRKQVPRQLNDLEKKRVEYLKMRNDVIRSSMVKEFDLGTSVGSSIVNMKPVCSASAIFRGEDR